MNAEERLREALAHIDPDFKVEFNHFTQLYTCEVRVDGNAYKESSRGKEQAMYAIVQRFRDRIPKG